MAYVSYGVSNFLPRLGRRSVGGLGATPPVLHDIYWTMGYTRSMSATESAAFRACVDAKRPSMKTQAPKAVLDECQKQVMVGATAEMQRNADLIAYAKAVEEKRNADLIAYAAAVKASQSGLGPAPVAPAAPDTMFPGAPVTVSAPAEQAEASALNTTRVAWWVAGGAALIVGYLVLRK